MNYVYKYVSDGKIIYIGKCDREIYKRIEEHKREKKFKPFQGNVQIYYASVANSTMSDVVESELIRRYKPELNVAKMSDWAGIEFVEPEWKLLTEEEVKKEKKGKKKKPLTTKQIENRLKETKEIEVALVLAIEFYEKHLKSADIKRRRKEYGIVYQIQLKGMNNEQGWLWSHAIMRIGNRWSVQSSGYILLSSIEYKRDVMIITLGEFCNPDRFNAEMELAIEQSRKKYCELYDSLEREMQEGA